MTDQRRFGVIEVHASTPTPTTCPSAVRCGRKSNGHRRGSVGAFKTPPVTALPIPNISSGKTRMCRQLSGLPSG